MVVYTFAFILVSGTFIPSPGSDESRTELKEKHTNLRLYIYLGCLNACIVCTVHACVEFAIR